MVPLMIQDADHRNDNPHHRPVCTGMGCTGDCIDVFDAALRDWAGSTRLHIDDLVLRV